MRRLKLMLAFPLIVSCSTDVYKRTQNSHDAEKNIAEKYLINSKNDNLTKNVTPVQVSDSVYLGNKSSVSTHGDPLPIQFEGKTGISMNSGMPLKLDGVVKMLEEITNIPIIKKDYVVYNTQKNATGTAEVTKVSEELSKVMGENSEKSAASTSSLQSLLDLKASTDYMAVDYSGPLSVFLDKFSSHFDLAWQYVDGQLLISTDEVRKFSISSLPKKIESTSSIGSESSGSSGGGGTGGSNSSSSGTSEQTLDMEVSLDFWKDVDSELKVLLGDIGAYSISQSTSSILVRTSPSVMKKVSEYLDGLNQQLERQVTVNVEVYSVSTNDSSNFNLSLKGLLTRNGGIFGSVTGDYGTTAGSTFAGYWNGNGSDENRVLISALEENGNVSNVTSAVVTTMSGVPVPVLVGSESTYVSELGTSFNDNVATTTARTDTITSGFLMNLLPRVMDNGNILLQYGVNLSTLVGAYGGFDQVVVSGTTIQLPIVDKRSFIQSSMLKNGSTLVLAGFEKKRNEVVDQGIGSANFKFLGGKRQGNQEREIMVICITPRIIDIKGS